MKRRRFMTAIVGVAALGPVVKRSEAGNLAEIGGGWWASIHTANPGKTGKNEVSGRTYARRPITVNPSQQYFTDMPTVLISHFGIWDSATGGKFIKGHALDRSKVVGSGDTVRMDLVIDLNWN